MSKTKSRTSNRSYRIPVELLERVEADAERRDRSVNYLVVKCLEKCYPSQTSETPERYTTDQAD